MTTPRPGYAEPPWIVAIGASGGSGLNDVKELLGALPSNITAVIMVVVHRPWDSPSLLRSVLAGATSLPVTVAVNGQHLEAGTVYVGEPALHMILRENARCGIVRDPHRAYGNRTIDLLFKSVAEHAGTSMIGVILSGSLDDGSRGLAAIQGGGGITMVRAPIKADGGEMPHNAMTASNPVTVLGSLGDIARSICAACAG
jgi:two-component system, chemotaxis family, protein-glutamate methylesterase/glutaminase